MGSANDRIAWLTLSGQISHAEASIKAKQTPEFRAKKRAEQLGKPKPWQQGDRNVAKRISVRKKISINNPMKRPEIAALFQGENSKSKQPSTKAKMIAKWTPERRQTLIDRNKGNQHHKRRKVNSNQFLKARGA